MKKFQSTLAGSMMALSVGAMALGGCIVDNDDGPISAPLGGMGGMGSGGGGGSIPEGMAMIRVVHGSPDAPTVDIYAEGVGNPQLTGLSFGDTSEYLVVPPGSYNFQVRASPSTEADAIAYETGLIEVREGDRLTTVAAGLLGSDADSDRFRVLAYNESFGPAGAGNAVVRVVHAGADAPSVGIDLHNDDPSSPEVTGLDRFTASDPAGVLLSSGEALQIGIASGGERVTAFTTPALPDGAQLFVIATGLTGRLAREADGFSLLAVGPDGTIGFIRQNPIVYALHASPNAPEVDAFAGDAEVIGGLAFGELSDPLQVPPGSYELAFYGTTEGTDRPAGPPAAEAGTSFEAGQRYLTIATGLLGDTTNPFQLASYAEEFDLDSDDPRLRLVHASPDAPAVDVGILNVENVVNPVLVSNVSFPAASAASGLVPGVGQIPLGVTPTGVNDTVVASFHVTTAPGQRVFAVAAGALHMSNGEAFRLLAVDTGLSPWGVESIDPQPQN